MCVADSVMITPQKATVRPRVVLPHSGETVLLESAIEDLLAQSNYARIQVLGGAGAGKTTALRHLAAVLPPEANVTLIDDATEAPGPFLVVGGRVIFAGRKRLRDPAVTVLSLAPWTDDDLIEYLLAVSPDRCTSVMRRVALSPEKPLLAGNPTLWRMVLDELVADEMVVSIRQAIEWRLSRLFAAAKEREIAGAWCLAILTRDNPAAILLLQQLAKCDADFDRIRPLRHTFVQQILAAEHICNRLTATESCDALAMKLPEALVEEIARRVTNDDNLRQRLLLVLEREHRRFHPQAASILHAAGTKWRPADDRAHYLRGGHFRGAVWPGVRFAKSAVLRPRSDLSDADLTDANLQDANLDETHLAGAILVRANLRGASLKMAAAGSIDLSDADLTNAVMDWANLKKACLERTVLNGASLIAINLEGGNLRGADFRNANLTSSVLADCQIEDANFSDANMHHVNVAGLRLRLATFSAVWLPEANLMGCDLEGVEWPEANLFRATLKDAFLTGSSMPRADLREANLRGAGLADIQWEGADLSGADLRGCTFHMGSTRSGLVGSPYPGHGSKTGFYTDDYFDQGYKAPEEIRKANLCGADLRGAKIDKVDFYLVDLRRALYDASATEHLQRCGAILVERSH
jgi:uncharacterized protein YjbI with pentapeptide repeats